MSNDIIVYDKPSGGVPLCLPESARIGGGGEGAVYSAKIPGNSREIAVKVFNDKKLSKNRDVLTRKIAEMVRIGRKDKSALIHFSRHCMAAVGGVP